MRSTSSLSITFLLALTAFCMSILPGRAAETADSQKFQHLSPDFKKNDCKNASCYQVTQAAGVAASFDTGVYKIYKTKRELEGDQSSLETQRKVLKGYQLQDERQRGQDPLLKRYITSSEAEIQRLETKIPTLQKDLRDDLLKAGQIYGISNLSDIHIVDEENKDPLSAASGDRGGFALLMRKEEQGKITYVVSLKGTEKSSVNDIFADFDSDPSKLGEGNKGRYASVESSDVLVPNGFRQYAKAVIDDRNGLSFSLVQEVAKLQQEGKPVEVVVTGHSLGGASSVIYSAMLQDRGIKPENIKTITFAAPPAANQQQFVNRYGRLGLNLTRVEDYGDAVIDLPINTSSDNVAGIPLIGGKAKKTIDNYHVYYIDSQSNPFLYGEVLSGPKVGETLNDKVERLRSFRSKLDGLSNAEFWNKSDLVKELAELNVLIKQEGLLEANSWTGFGTLALATTLNNLNPFGNLFPTLQEILSTPFRLNELGRVSVDQIKAQYTAAIDILRVKKLIDKAGVHVAYGDYYQYGSQFIQPAQLSSGGSLSIVNAEMLVYNSCMAQVSSSHIGSASCSFRTSGQAVQDEIEAQTFASRGRIESTQQANQYTNGQIVKVPLDIGLTWNQNTKLDLDSHLATPNGEHIYFSDRGKLNNAPNAFLYRDSIPNGGLKGAEQTRITQFQDGQYRFYVYNYSEADGQESARIAGPNGLSNSGATVKLYEGGAPLTDIPNDPAVFNLNDPNVQKVGNPYPGNSTFNVPTNQPGNTWYVFKLDTRTGILTRVDRFGNSPKSGTVPNVR
jgi:hypothetical protein